jgi:hypothetical protein
VCLVSAAVFTITSYVYAVVGTFENSKDLCSNTSLVNEPVFKSNLFRTSS